MIHAADRPARSGGGLFLDALADPQRQAIDARHVLAVFAHPDDETISIGGQLSRLDGIRLICITDGAPDDMRDAHRNGFSRREDYAAARHEELVACLAVAGIPEQALQQWNIRDQRAAFHMASLATKLRDRLHVEEIGIVITHGYEGGHPDHDAAAFVVHAACRMLEREGAAVPAIIECPLYRVGDRGRVFQQFVPPTPAGDREVWVELDQAAAATKQRMLDAHVTQQYLIGSFRIVGEKYRPAPRHDFSRLPNEGRLLYANFGWEMNGSEWLRLTAAASAELELPP